MQSFGGRAIYAFLWTRANQMGYALWWRAGSYSKVPTQRSTSGPIYWRVALT